MERMEKTGKETSLPEQKKLLRREIILLRNSLQPLMRRQKSDKILQTVYQTNIYKKTKIILTYADYQSEVITSPLIEKALLDKKKVFCPKVSGDDMDFYRIKGLNELKEGYKGIREPAAGEKFQDNMDGLSVLVLVPGAVFDKNCHRIGYGKGFYDKFLTRMSENDIDIYTIGLGYECQLVDEVPREIHDFSLDMIVTEDNIYMRGM